MNGRSVHVVLPGGVTDPGRPSGGNMYDLRVCDGLAALGWTVHRHEATGPWPMADTAALDELAALLDALPDRGVVLVDGLLGAPGAAVLVPRADRLRLVPLVHLSLGLQPADPVDADAGDREHELLESAAAVITTSRWTRRQLLDGYGLWPGQVYVAEPGVEAAPLAPGSPAGDRLVCVAALVPHKGQDALLQAVAGLVDLPWTLDLIGPTDRAPDFVTGLRDRIASAGLTDRVRLVGPLVGSALDRAREDADLELLTSRTEAYGMVVAEALARGTPVVGSEIGGIPEALGRCPDGRRPGFLVPPDDPSRLAATLRRWLTDPQLRAELRELAAQRREQLHDWDATAERVATVLTQVAG